MTTRPHAVDARSPRIAGFHEGERAVQERAGVRNEAARLEGMLAPSELGGGAAAFLGAQTFAVLTARDDTGRLWTSPLVSTPGFLVRRAGSLLVHTVPENGDPLRDLPAGQAAGMLALDPVRRRRLRINGWLSATSRLGLTLDVEEAYGNCPSYIQQRALTAAPTSAVGTRPALADGVLTDDVVRLVRSADTVFLGTQHPTRGTDASHRGGGPGFVRVEGSDLSWPDYPGNNMYNSMGNLAVDPSASLLFIGFDAGLAVQLSGRARVEWEPEDPTTTAETETGRRVRFSTEQGLLRSTGVHQLRDPAIA